MTIWSKRFLQVMNEWITKPALGEGPGGPPRFVRNNKNNDNNNRVIIEGEKMPKNFENDKAFPCYLFSAFCNCKTVWNFTAIFLHKSELPNTEMRQLKFSLHATYGTTTIPPQPPALLCTWIQYPRNLKNCCVSLVVFFSFR